LTYNHWWGTFNNEDKLPGAFREGLHMRDMDIRLALRRDLVQEHQDEPSTLIVEELGLCQGDSRVDMAVVNGAINGYEIKSERDTLTRLPMQQEIYNRTLDRITLVASAKHMEAAEKLVPWWWGLQEAIDGPDGVCIQTHRQAVDNPNVDPHSVVQLLWRNETLAVLMNLGLEKGRLSKPRHVLWGALATALPIDELKAVVRAQLKARANWRSDI
jgi:hypothetical protein